MSGRDVEIRDAARRLQDRPTRENPAEAQVLNLVPDLLALRPIGGVANTPASAAMGVPAPVIQKLNAIVREV